MTWIIFLLVCHLNLWVLFRKDFFSTIVKYNISKKLRDVIIQWLLFYFEGQVTVIPFSSTGTFFEKMDPKIEEMAKYNDYATNFDPKVYLETNYCKIEGYWFVPSTLKAQHTIYSTGNWLFFWCLLPQALVARNYQPGPFFNFLFYIYFQ